MKENIYKVAQINHYIKNMFAQDFVLNHISVSGEVSNCKYHPSGHIYFTIKDEGSALNAIMFSGNRKGLSFMMRDGDHIVASGSIEVYDRDGKYQLYAKKIIPAGTGELYLRYEALKRELEEMGMFAAEYKRPIPKFAMRVGIVTASTGAAIRDICNISGRRNPYVQLILYPALVQGEGAAASIVNGIRALDAMGLDVLIVGRGGGSIEDLWAFNEEIVARAVFECGTPVISAVGHETDTTIIDYVADMRAPTPSAAAELAVFDIRAFYEKLGNCRVLLEKNMSAQLAGARGRLKQMQKHLRYLSPANQLNQKRQYAAGLEETLRRQMRDLLLARKRRLEFFAGRLDGISPLKRLWQGYSFVAGPDGRGISDVRQVREGETLDIHVLNGNIYASVMRTEEKERRGDGAESGT